jgi:RimK family alpha-L-glutamate ligase
MPPCAHRGTLVGLEVIVSAVETARDEAAPVVATSRRVGPGRALACKVLIVTSMPNEASIELVESWQRLGLDAELASGAEALAAYRPGDRVIGRLDVLPTLDGVEPGMLALLLLERRGARLVNTAGSLLRAHDKLRAGRLLTSLGLPHPATRPVATIDAAAALEPPFVLKPRFGSWGKSVYRCDTRASQATCLDEIETTPWFRRHGALVQELIPPLGHDLRVLVADGRVVGAIERIAAEGEWRTNISLGGTSRPSRPSSDAAELARTAAVVVGTDLVGVDLLPLATGGHLVLELNGAVDFDHDYSLGTLDVFAEVADALDLVPWAV